LFVASECAPLTKTGGLADVAAALPVALAQLGVDIRVLLPGYGSVLANIADARSIARIPGHGAFPSASLLAAHGPHGERFLILACDALYVRDGGPYQDASGRDWDDNALRFGYLSRVAAMLCSPQSPIDWGYDVLHCNDWQSGLAPAYLHWQGPQYTPSLMTIHNLAYQGLFPAAMLSTLGLPAAAYNMNGVEYYGQLSFLKAGLYYATRLSTVSPTYAREIQSEPLGFGLHGLLATRGRLLDGILNGIDTSTWDPATDASIAATYDAASLARKRLNTTALRKRFGLALRPEVPLLGIVSRQIHQKGIDLVCEVAHDIVNLPAQLLVLGTGEPAIEQALAVLARQHPQMIAVVRGFDEALSHLVEAGADIFLMPSRFEPCGLNQMYSQRYGTPPVARRTGGLADSIVDCAPGSIADGTGTGFLFDEPDAGALLRTIRRAVDLWHVPGQWQRIQANGMARDFSWTQSARRYLALYQDMMTHR
jgi:starch synthase